LIRGADSRPEEREETTSPEQKTALPDDLLGVDVDSDQEDETTSESPQVGRPHPGFVDDAATKPKPIGRVLLIIAVITAFVVGLIGYVRRGSFATVVGRALFPSTPSTTLVDSYNRLVLMLEQDGDYGRVIVQKSDQGGWLLVSQDDTTATSPILSPTGQEVAYVSRRNGGQVVAVSLITGTRRLIGTKRIGDVGRHVGLGSMVLCSWTPIAWSPKGDRIAFFACAEDNSFSVATVADLLDPTITLSVIGQSKTKTSDARQIKWLDATQLVISTPDKDQSTIDTFDVP
jgi:hypothetical protein